LERAAIGGNGFVDLASLPQRDPQIVMGIRIAGLQFERATKRGNGFVELTAVPQRRAQIVVGHRVGGLDCECAATRGNGFLQSTGRAAGFTKVGMSGGIIRVEGNGLANPFHREVIAARLVSDDAEEVQRVSMLWLHRKDLAVERFGFRQTPGAVMLKRDLKRLWDGHGGNCGLERRVEARG
jgi:hypothetical protein